MDDEPAGEAEAGVPQGVGRGEGALVAAVAGALGAANVGLVAALTAEVERNGVEAATPAAHVVPHPCSLAWGVGPRLA